MYSRLSEHPFRPKNDNDNEHRLNNIHLLEKLGREKWQKYTGYNQRSLVENSISRYKTIIGRSLIFKNTKSQINELNISANILNKMGRIGIPKTCKNGKITARNSTGLF